ncbi:hypothetical protein ABG768_003134, partial [Culter alburnus]
SGGQAVTASFSDQLSCVTLTGGCDTCDRKYSEDRALIGTIIKPRSRRAVTSTPALTPDRCRCPPVSRNDADAFLK